MRSKHLAEFNVSLTVFHNPVGRSSEIEKMYSFWRSTYWVVKHRVRETNWSFRWLWRLPSESVSITEDWTLFVRRTFIFLSTINIRSFWLVCFDQTQSIARVFNLSAFSSIYFSFQLWTFICQIWGSPVGETLSSFSPLLLPFILGFILTSLQTQTSLDSLRLTLEDNMKIPANI